MSSAMTHFAASWLKLLRRHQVARSKLVSRWVFPGKTGGGVGWAVVRGKMQIIDIRDTPQKSYMP